jgi:hypothetical protein
MLPVYSEPGAEGAHVFLSGRYRGYWEQVFWGRQPMNDLVLHFEDGIITGDGEDVIGKFTFSGRYDKQGTLVMVKQYLGKHQVHYEGRYDGEGTIHGTWSIGSLWTGPFALAAEPKNVADLPIRDL